MLLDKLGQMCESADPNEEIEPITKDDTDVMWNDFMRFRKRIKYNLMSVVLCCCTRSCRVKADSELYN